MKQKDDASVSVVGQPDSNMRGDDPKPHGKDFGAVDGEKPQPQKPPGLSWGDYIERLQEKER